MRRIALSLLLLFGLLLPASVSAAPARCSLEVSPAVGSSTDVYRITVTDVPVLADGGSLEVRTDIRRLGSREGAVIFAFLVPGATQFYFDYNATDPGEPQPQGLTEGRYLVTVSTPHMRGACHATETFVVEG